MFLPCSLHALCPSSPPCRVAVATIAAPRYPARGGSSGQSPRPPRGLWPLPSAPQGAPHFVCVLDIINILLIFH